MKVAIICACLIALSGCSSSFFSKFAITDNAANPIIEGQDKFAKVDLVALLDPKQYGRVDSFEGLENLDRAIGNPDKNEFFEKVRNELKEDPTGQAGLDRLENAFHGFYNSNYGAANQVRRRNSVQARLIGASDQECAFFLDEVRQDQAGFNFALGSLTSVLGGVGAIVTGADVARAFSGAAAIASGIRAEGNDANFRQLTAEVIVRGIETKRAELLEAIKPRRKALIDNYTAEDAVADAVRYHSFCNLISGLEHASKQVQLSQDPGLKRTMRLLKNAGIKGDFTFDLDQVAPDTEDVTTSTSLLSVVSDSEAVRNNASGGIRAIEQLLGDASASVDSLKQALANKKAELANVESQQAKLSEIEGNISPLEKGVASIAELYANASALNAEVISLTVQNKVADAAKKVVDIAELTASAQRTFDDVSKEASNLSSQLQKLVAPEAPTTEGG